MLGWAASCSNSFWDALALLRLAHGMPQHPLCAPLHLCQGGVERLGQTAKTKLRAAHLDMPETEWPTELLRVQKQINNCPTRVLGGRCGIACHPLVICQCLHACNIGVACM